ncbi:portal protein [Halodesulfovibrio sp.]|jgi:hypothetical protein|uniref:portal protein n=1 Tax=Halodesulfovibrio sp. TaxID=1912772 RepID=UPI0025CE7926|nr:portal protein [Halodesulfovibrio sp.]MCT4626979.1 portal protein [Halodesulfovibrio sp.]
MNELVKELKQRLGVLKKSRRRAEEDWEELAEYLQPPKARFFGDDSSDAEARELIWSSVPEDAQQQFAAGLHSLLTNPAQTWLHTALTGRGVKELPSESTEWASEIASIIMDACKHEESGFDSTMNECYLDYATFGQMGLFVEDPEDNSAIPFSSISPHACWISENQHGIVDTMFRRLELTVRQVQERWGKRKRGITSDLWQKRTYSDSIQRKIDRKELESTVYVWQAIYPRKTGEWYEEATVPSKFMYASVFWEEETNQLLSEGGYREQPFMVARYSKFSGADPWGRGVGHIALPHIRLLHAQEDSKDGAIQNQCEPPLAVDKSMYKDGISTDSKATNYFEASSVTGEKNYGIYPIVSSANVEAVHMTVKDREEQIRSIFFNDQLQMVGGPNMTAYEVALRDSKKMMLLLPMWGRLATEFLPIFVNRMVGILERRGDIPERPAIVDSLIEQGVVSRLKVAYVSPISMAQKASEAQTFQRTLEYLTPIINMRPQVMDNFDLDEVVRDSQNLFGFPQKYLVDAEKRDANRQQQAQQAAQAQDVQAGQEMAQAAKTAGEAAGNAEAIKEALTMMQGGAGA